MQNFYTIENTGHTGHIGHTGHTEHTGHTGHIGHTEFVKQYTECKHSSKRMKVPQTCPKSVLNLAGI